MFHTLDNCSYQLSWVKAKAVRQPSGRKLSCKIQACFKMQSCFAKSCSNCLKLHFIAFYYAPTKEWKLAAACNKFRSNPLFYGLQLASFEYLFEEILSLFIRIFSPPVQVSGRTWTFPCQVISVNYMQHVSFLQRNFIRWRKRLAFVDVPWRRKTLIDFCLCFEMDFRPLQDAATTVSPVCWHNLRDFEPLL